MFNGTTRGRKATTNTTPVKLIPVLRVMKTHCKPTLIRTTLTIRLVIVTIIIRLKTGGKLLKKTNNQHLPLLPKKVRSRQWQPQTTTTITDLLN